MGEHLQSIRQKINEIPMVDAHTHVDAGHLTARGLHDILLYHMHISDLYSAGCPSGERLEENASQEEIERRIIEAIPYIPYVENTSCAWGVRTILKNLYDWTEPVTLENWRKLDARIKQKYQDSNWSREILKKAGIEKVSTELWRGKDGSANDILFYAIEWAFFTRTQWGQYDTALLELEHAWNQEVPGEPLPVTTDISKLHFEKKVYTLEDLDEAIRYYCEKIPYDKIVGIASHFSTDIHYRSVTRQEMEMALINRENAGEKERDIYANYIFEEFLKEYDRQGRTAVLQFSIGAEPLPYETGSKLCMETVFEIASIMSRYPRIQFQFTLSNAHQNQALCTLARELPNVSLSGYWWHNFFPEYIRRVMSERLDMLPLNKQIGFFSDAYCLDWAYAKSLIVREALSQVLAQRVEQGQYTEEMAIEYAKQILYQTPADLLKVKL